MNRILVCLLFLALISVPALAQTGIVQNSSTSLLQIDPVTNTLVTLPGGGGGAVRGFCMGHDNALYQSWWTVNGIGRLDLSTNTWTTVCKDSTNLILGAPYVPAYNYDAMGGPGLWVVDGNPIATSFRNTCTIDMTANTFAPDQVFANTFTPMSDGYPHPYKGGKFIGVGFSTSDLRILEFTLQSPAPNTIDPTVIATLKTPCSYDSFIHEDTNLYCWSATSGAFIGLEQVDLNSATTNTISLGITYASTYYGAAWNEPWEQPGRLAYIVYNGDDKAYKVDLAATPPTAVSVVTLPAGSYYHGREVEEAQLVSWKISNTGRNFHLNFGAANGGNFYVLAPSVAGYSPTAITLPPNGLELWLWPDLFTFMGVTGTLGYASQGTLSRSGEADVKVDFGVTVGLNVLWAAVAYDAKGVQDISNLIMVDM